MDINHNLVTKRVILTDTDKKVILTNSDVCTDLHGRGCGTLEVEDTKAEKDE